MKFPMHLQPCITPDDDLSTGGGGGGAAPEHDEDKHNDPGTPPAPAAPAKVDPPKADPDARSPVISRDRFDAVNTKYRTLQGTHSALSEKYQSTVSERDALKNEATTAKEHATQLETALSDILSARLELLPEDKRDLIPEGLPVEQKLSWLEKAMAKGIFGTAQQVPIGTPTNPAPGNATLHIDSMSPGALLKAGYGAKS